MIMILIGISTPDGTGIRVRQRQPARLPEYAKNFRMWPSPPKQWLLFVHPKFGVTARWPILLGHLSGSARRRSTICSWQEEGNDP